MLLEIVLCVLWNPNAGSSYYHSLKGENGVNNWRNAYYSTYIVRNIENMDPRIIIEITPIKHINNSIVPNPRNAEKL